MRKINDNLFVSDENFHIKDIVENRIDVIVNVATEVNIKELAEICIKVSLDDPPIDIERFSKNIVIAIKLTKQLLDSGRRVLVHCRCGIFRSVMVCIFVIALKYYRTLEFKPFMNCLDKALIDMEKVQEKEWNYFHDDFFKNHYELISYCLFCDGSA